jgi:Leu/Phe-tRNA-protein transferase
LWPNEGTIPVVFLWKTEESHGWLKPSDFGYTNLLSETLRVPSYKQPTLNFKFAQVIRGRASGSKTAVMSVISFLCVSLGSSTVPTIVTSGRY